MHKNMVTRSFEGVWESMSRNRNGILLPPPILEAIKLRNLKGVTDKLILFTGKELEYDLTGGYIRYLRAYDMSVVGNVGSYLMGGYGHIEGMRLDISELPSSVLPLGNRAGIVGFKDYFDIMDPADMEDYESLIREDDSLDDLSGCL